MSNGTVVLYMSNEGYLGCTFECYSHDDIHLAINKICDDLGIDYLTDEQVGEAIEYCEYDISRDCHYCGETKESGRILIYLKPLFKSIS